MGKRLGRKRLFALNKLGQSVASSAGAGIKDSIGSQTEMRDGSLITTDYQIDLANATAPASSFATVGSGASATNIIGVSSSSGTHSNAQVVLLQNSINGMIESVELVCVEAPTVGGLNLGLWYADNLSGSGNALDAGSGTELIACATQADGKVGATSNLDTDLDGVYVYIAHSGSSAAVYTAGKFVLRTYGYKIFADV